MKHKFTIGQEVWAKKEAGRWGEALFVKGMIIDIREHLSSFTATYIIRGETGGIYEVSEKKLEEINDPKYEPFLGC